MTLEDLEFEVAAVASELGVTVNTVWAAPVALLEALRRGMRRKALLGALN